MRINKESIGKALGWGLASSALYATLFAFSDQLVEWAHRTREGEKLFFLVPIVVAFALSYVHGAFTGYFWDVLGLRAAKGGGGSKKH
ncbi:MAG: hypothetical protein Fur0039_12570 [Rhodocyclaceae bacterium]